VKIIQGAVLILAALGAGQGIHAQTTNRQSINFNQSWKFRLGDFAGAQSNSFDDASWSAVGLPHTFNLPYFMWPQFYIGYGWYRKHFTVPAEWSGKRVSFEFQAAFQDAQIYVNGALVGLHKGGYNGFSVDATSAIVTGDNVVAVRLNNNWNAQLAPRAGDHTFNGGLYRDVHLVVTDPLHVTWYGTYATTPTLAANAGTSSTVNVKTEIANDDTNSVSCTVQTDILDANSNIVATVSSTQSVPAGATNVFDQTTPPVSNPQLWSPAAPNLNRAATTVFHGTNIVDTYYTTFGFRWISWTATNGFFLNGSHLYFHGANVHQDHAGWGDGVTDSALARDVQMVKDAGFNFIRGSHYPKAPTFADACDQIGVLFWSENCFWGLGGASGEGSWNTAGAYPNNAGDQSAFDTSVTNSLAEMIRIHRNHPSIIAWSLSNEPFFTAWETMAQMRALLSNEVAVAHLLDPTRPAAIGGAQRPTDSSRIDFIGDVAGYNGDGATISVFQNPGIPNMVSEYSLVSVYRPGNYDPAWGDLSSQLDTNGFPIEYSWRGGQSLWCMFDHGSVAGNYLALTGIVDYFRLPKRAWYWYRNAYRGVSPPTWPTNGTPARLGLSATTTNLTAVDGTQDALLTVTILDAAGNPISNNVPVTLSITSGPGEFPTGTNITFSPPSSDPQSDIFIRDGQAAIEFRTYYSGTTVVTATSSGLTSTNITIISHGNPVWVPGVTPPVADRPYSRTISAPPPPPTNTLLLALNRPTSASSTASGTSASANDGNTNTIWLAASADSNAWWGVSLETVYAVNMIELTFPTNGNYRYTISTSSDGSTWNTVVNQSSNSNTDQTRRAVGNFGSSVGYVRVNFVGLPPGQPPGLAEVSVGGAFSLTFKTNQLGGSIIGTLGSYNNGGTTREMAMDWDLNTYFDGPDSSGGSNCWVGLDLGTGVSAVITQINYCPRGDQPSRMVGGVFQGANQPDFGDAMKLFTVTAQPTTSVLTTRLVTSTNAFRYVRYLSPSGGWGDVAEIEFYPKVTLPATPTALTATPGTGTVSLAWNAAANASSYNVKRSLTSGSGYVTLTNVAGTTFTNTGLADGTTYYFVVSATNSFGESANSAEASATTLSTFQLWQLAYFGCWACPQADPAADPDGDGTSNTNEFLAGTSPTDGSSAFWILSITPTGADVVLSWQSAPGKTNYLQAGALTNYTDIAGPIGITVTPTNATDYGGATNSGSRFYRIRLVP